MTKQTIIVVIGSLRVKRYFSARCFFWSNSCSFPQYFQYIFNLHIHLWNVVVRFIFFSSANLVCRCKDTSNFFRETLELRDTESRLYFKNCEILKIQLLFYTFTYMYMCPYLTLLLLSTTCPVLANNVDPDLKKPTDLDLHCLSLNMWISIKNTDQVIWLAGN